MIIIAFNIAKILREMSTILKISFNNSQDNELLLLFMGILNKKVVFNFI